MTFIVGPDPGSFMTLSRVRSETGSRGPSEFGKTKIPDRMTRFLS